MLEKRIRAYRVMGYAEETPPRSDRGPIVEYTKTKGERPGAESFVRWGGSPRRSGVGHGAERDLPVAELANFPLAHETQVLFTTSRPRGQTSFLSSATL